MFRFRGTSFSRSSRFLAHLTVKSILCPNETLVVNSSLFEEKDWPGVCDMPEYQNMKRLDAYVNGRAVGQVALTSSSRYQNRLADWCQSRIRSQQGHDLLRQLFAYDPDKRLTVKEALGHRWFQEDPRPTRKLVGPKVPFFLPLGAHISIVTTDSVFQYVPAHQIPPQRRITQDEAPSMMGVPAPTQPHTQPQGPTAHGHGQGQHLSQQSKPGSTTSFASVSAGAGAMQGYNTVQGGSSRKKARLG